MSAFEFQYFISEKNGFVVASLVGQLDQNCLAKLEEMSADVSGHQFRKLILNFRDVSGVTGDAVPAIARLQRLAREREADLRVCGLRPEVKDRLHREGILRPHELTDNLQTALQSMIAVSRSSASKRAS